MLGWSFVASVTQLLTYFRRESHLILLPLASALQATIARLRAALPDGLAASAAQGITAATLTSRTERHTFEELRHNALQRFVLCEQLPS
jgi:hypothetical protein